MNKEIDLKFIKLFSKIKIKDICEKNNIDVSNVWAGKCSAEKIGIIRKEIEIELNNIYLKALKGNENNE